MPGGVRARRRWGSGTTSSGSRPASKRPAPRAHAHKQQPLVRMDASAADETRSAAAAGFERDREARCPPARGVCALAARARAPTVGHRRRCSALHERAPARRTAKRPIPSRTRRCSLQMHANGIAEGRSRPSAAALASRFKRARPRFPLQASRRAAPLRCSWVRDCAIAPCGGVGVFECGARVTQTLKP
jgi:hypothetical protein